MAEFTYTHIGTLLRLGQVEEAEGRIFRAFEECDFSIARVAQSLGCKRATVESWLQRRKTLRTRIREAQAQKAIKALDELHAT